jgi:hypothetical protein
MPPGLAAGGTAQVSALVHPCPNFHLWAALPDRFGLTDAPDPQDARFQPPANFVLGRLWGLLQRGRPDGPGLAEVCRSIPQEALGLVRRALAGPPQPDWLWPRDSEWDWPDEGWLEQLRAAGVEAGLLPPVVKYIEAERLAEAMYRRTPQRSPEWPAEAMLALAGAIAEVRGRQLTAMTAAMGRFVGAVFPS